MDDPYEPTVPNEYMEVQRDREMKRSYERREKQRQQHLERLEQEQERLACERQEAAKKSVAGDAPAPSTERGVSNLPAWMKSGAQYVLSLRIT